MGRCLALSLVFLVGCSAPGPSGTHMGTPAVTGAPTADSSVPRSSGTPDIPGPGDEFDTTMGRDAIPFVGHMFIFEDITPGPDPVIPDPAARTNVTLGLDGGAAQTTLVPQAGGTVSATGSDGTVYTLEISPTALTTDVDITMTPISSVSVIDESGSDVPWEGALGVQLEPEGLHLFEAAVLRIQPTGVGAANWVALAAGPGGRDAHAYPLFNDRDVPTLPITHFSGYVVGHTWPPIPDGFPEYLQGHLELDLATALEDGVLDDDERGGITEKYLAPLLAILDRAVEDCAFAESGAIAIVRSMAALLEALGYLGEFSAFVRPRLVAAIMNCIRELLEAPCFDLENPVHKARFSTFIRQLEQMEALEESRPTILDMLRRERQECPATVSGTLSYANWFVIQDMDGQTPTRTNSLQTWTMTVTADPAEDEPTSFAAVAGSWHMDYTFDNWQDRRYSGGADGCIWTEHARASFHGDWDGNSLDFSYDPATLWATVSFSITPGGTYPFTSQCPGVIDSTTAQEDASSTIFAAGIYSVQGVRDGDRISFEFDEERVASNVITAHLSGTLVTSRLPSP